MKYKLNAQIAGIGGLGCFAGAIIFGQPLLVAAEASTFVFVASFAWNCFVDHIGKGKS